MKCPICNSDDVVGIFEKGLKKLLRAILFNHRYICYSCSITWRRQNPSDWQKLKGLQNES
jgi:transposase-like protein